MKNYLRRKNNRKYDQLLKTYQLEQLELELARANYSPKNNNDLKCLIYL